MTQRRFELVNAALEEKVMGLLKSTLQRCFAAAFAVGTLMPSSLALGEETLAKAEQVTRVSQALRGGLLPEADLVKKATEAPDTVDLKALVGEWLKSDAFYGNMRNWHMQMFRSPYL